jgi:16S rRNA processing protein RimM
LTARTRICLGAFAGAHGVRGEARVKTFTESEEGVARYGAVETETGDRCFTLSFIRVLKPGLALVSALEIKNREDAQALAGTLFYVDRAALPAAADDEFYVEDLIGLRAVDIVGADLGRVEAVYNFGAGDIVELRGALGGSAPILAPLTRAAIPVIDIAGGRITVDAAALAEAGGPSDRALIAEAMRQEDA